MPQWLQVFGRFHPVVLHLPIGALVALALVEAAALARRRPADPDITRVLVWLCAASAIVAGGAGFVLSYEDGYTTDTVSTHLWLGIAVVVGTVFMAALHARRLRGLYYGVMVLTLGVLVPAGHYGGTITHGDGFLTGPLRTGEVRPVSTAAGVQGASPSTFTLTIAPVFEARCAKCHGPSRQKGGLVLNSREGIAKGGDAGPVLVAGKVADSEIVRRLRLPLDDEDHMPPKGKPQATENEIRVIESWIAAGAAFEGVVGGIEAGAPAPKADGVKASGPAAASTAAVSALQDRLVHVQPIAGDSNLLWIDFAAVPKTTDSEALALLAPVREQVSDLSLGRCAVGDETVGLAAKMPNLVRLDVRATGVTDTGLAALRDHAKLEELVLAQTHLTDASVDQIAAMPALKRVHLWHSGVSPEAVSKLREKRPTLAVDAGDESLAAAVETEKDLKLTGDAPPPGQAPTPAVGASLEPINKVCPVSGTAVDPQYAVVYKGRVIGFCCPKCPSQFWADPEKFVANLPK